MTDIKSYDHFLLDLISQLKNNPHLKSQIISRALEQTGCPYLKEKIRRLESDIKQTNRL